MQKKLIAPIIVTVITIAFLLGYFGMIFVLIPLSVGLRLLIGMIRFAWQVSPSMYSLNALRK